MSSAFVGIDGETRAKAIAAYRAFNDSPMQQRLREEQSCLVAVVWWNPQEDTPERLHAEMRRIAEAGLTGVRFHVIDPHQREDGTYDWRYPDLRFEAAHAAGLKVIPCMGFHRKYDLATLARHGLTGEQAGELPPDDPRVVEARDVYMEKVIGRYGKHPATAMWPTSGEPSGNRVPLETEADRDAFGQWLIDRYGTPENVHHAWAIYPRTDPPFVGSWDDAVARACEIRADSAGGPHALATTAFRKEAYGVRRDLILFRTEQVGQAMAQVMQQMRRIDPDHPVGIGTHQFFYNQPQLAWNTGPRARTGDFFFSSIHLSWHFEHVELEVDRPVYMQARFTNDYLKGCLTNAFETTAGPVQYSGGYGNHMDAGLMRRLMFSYLAAGNQQIAFWDWHCRPGGLEAGEYAMCGYSGRLTEWGAEAGQVAQAMQKHRGEIWRAETEPDLAILRSWDTEAGLSMEPRRYDCDDGPSPMSRGPAHQHMRALIGASRAAINHQVAFEYLDLCELDAGFLEVYPAIYLPHVRNISDEHLDRLRRYVEAGGRLIADVQIGFEDPWAKVRVQGEGTPVERIFGAWIDSIHDTHTRSQRVDGAPVRGFFGELIPTRARVLKRFATGKPAVSEVTLGRGTATLVAFDPARMCWKPGDTATEAFLARLYRGPMPRRWRSDWPMTYRRTCDAADHYFLINDGPARHVSIHAYDHAYRRVEDVMTGETEDAAGTISTALPECSAVWLRCERGDT